MANEQLKRAGTPDPYNPLMPHRPVGGVFGKNVAISATEPTTILLPIAAQLLTRLRWKFTTTEAVPPSPMGVLSFTYRRPPPDEDTAYTVSGPLANQNVVKGTEAKADIEAGGESLLAITFTPDGGVDPDETITATFFDVMNQ